MAKENIDQRGSGAVAVPDSRQTDTTHTSRNRRVGLFGGLAAAGALAVLPAAVEPAVAAQSQAAGHGRLAAIVDCTGQDGPQRADIPQEGPLVSHTVLVRPSSQEDAIVGVEPGRRNPDKILVTPAVRGGVPQEVPNSQRHPSVLDIGRGIGGGAALVSGDAQIIVVCSSNGRPAAGLLDRMQNQVRGSGPGPVEVGFFGKSGAKPATSSRRG